jgi:hypothetical protein
MHTCGHCAARPPLPPHFPGEGQGDPGLIVTIYTSLGGKQDFQIKHTIIRLISNQHSLTTPPLQQQEASPSTAGRSMQPASSQIAMPCCQDPHLTMPHCTHCSGGSNSVGICTSHKPSATVPLWTVFEIIACHPFLYVLRRDRIVHAVEQHQPHTQCLWWCDKRIEYVG